MDIPEEEFQELLNKKTYKEIAKRWGVHENTVKKLKKKHKLKKINQIKKINIIRDVN